MSYAHHSTKTCILNRAIVFTYIWTVWNPQTSEIFGIHSYASNHIPGSLCECKYKYIIIQITSLPGIIADYCWSRGLWELQVRKSPWKQQPHKSAPKCTRDLINNSFWNSSQTQRQWALCAWCTHSQDNGKLILIYFHVLLYVSVDVRLACFVNA